MTSNLLRSKFRLLDGWTIINRRNPKIAVNASVLSIIKRALNAINKHRIFFFFFWLEKFVFSKLPSIKYSS